MIDDLIQQIRDALGDWLDADAPDDDIPRAIRQLRAELEMAIARQGPTAEDKAAMDVIRRAAELVK